jgi:hypothetical protein
MRRPGAARRRTCLSTPSLVSSRPGRACPPAPAPEDWPAPMRRLDGRARRSRGAEAVSGGGEAREAQAKRCSLNFSRRTRDSGTARPAMSLDDACSGRRVGASPPRCRLWSKLELHAALPVLLHSDFVCGCDAPARARCGRRRGGLNVGPRAGRKPRASCSAPSVFQPDQRAGPWDRRSSLPPLRLRQQRLFALRTLLWSERQTRSVHLALIR